MEFTEYVRKPFLVEAVQVTLENMSEIASMIGELRYKDNGTPYIHVDRRIVPNLYNVYLGYWVTKVDDNIRCYVRKVFAEQYVEANEETRALVDELSKKKAKA